MSALRHLDGAEAPLARRPVTLLHLSDTHGLHRSIETEFPLPPADIFIHTGDWTHRGKRSMNFDFDDWISTIKSRYRYVVLVGGNHEWKKHGKNPAAAARPKDFLLEQLPFINADPSCFLLDHESINLLGLIIVGSAWLPRSSNQDPDKPGPTKYHLIPDTGVDVLLTHGPPMGIFDKMENTDQTWGSSRNLYRKVLTARPGAHLFGHMHEQRGVWHRPSEEDDWRGGCTYEISPGSGDPIATGPPPHRSYPGTMIANNAMKNHPRLEGIKPRIAGGGLLIAAIPDGEGRWTFSLCSSGGDAASAAASPPVSPPTMAALSILDAEAKALYSAKHFEAAVAPHRALWEGRAILLGDAASGTLTAACNLIRVLLKVNRKDEAETLCAAELEKSRSALGADDAVTKKLSKLLAKARM